jgi:hypothetical protein
MFSIPINMRRVAVILGIIMLVFIVLEVNRRLEELNLLNKQNQFVQTQATQAVQTQSALQTRVAYAGSTNAVEEWARTYGHYIQDGDLPMVPIGQPGETPLEMSVPAPTPVTMANWQVWWDLFFGEH